MKVYRIENKNTGMGIFRNDDDDLIDELINKIARKHDRMRSNEILYNEFDIIYNSIFDYYFAYPNLTTLRKFQEPYLSRILNLTDRYAIYKIELKYFVYAYNQVAFKKEWILSKTDITNSYKK